MNIIAHEIPIIIPLPNINSLVDRDKQFLQIQNLIEVKEKMLHDKHKKIGIITQKNQFLDIVKNDYDKYYSYINQQKQEQIKALEILNNYINELTATSKLSKYNIEDANFEQQKILDEINLIKESLDNIVNDANEITHILNNKNKIK
jgi:hypothetical protein